MAGQWASDITLTTRRFRMVDCFLQGSFGHYYYVWEINSQSLRVAMMVKVCYVAPPLAANAGGFSNWAGIWS
jgi:hypothetical protein